MTHLQLSKPWSTSVSLHRQCLLFHDFDLLIGGRINLIETSPCNRDYAHLISYKCAKPRMA
jgi:hypothetical protein